MAREVVASAQRISIDVEEAIEERGKGLDDTGVDAGAGTIQWHLGRRRMVGPVPLGASLAAGRLHRAVDAH